MESSSDREDAPDPAQSGASDPITLTDPDGSVTRVAPWSSWTREQIRAPGGEPLLVTRLDAGQLWFAAGRRRSPWHHEIIAGPVTVTTGQGRFHVTAEADGGATIACLAGRTRVHARLSEPVIVGPNQVASVSADGTTVIVTDPIFASPGEQASASAALAASMAAGPELAADVRDELPGDKLVGHDDEPTPLPAVAGEGGSDAESEAMEEAQPSQDAVDETEDDGDDVAPAVTLATPMSDGAMRGRRMVPWLPELVAMAATLGVLIAAAVFFSGGSDGTAVVAAPRTSVVTTLDVSTSPAPATDAPITTAAPTTPAPPTTAPPTTAPPTTAPPTTAPPTTAPPTTPPAVSAPATATGRLTGCRRADGGVRATVTVSHQSGGAGTFAVQVGLVDGSGVFAQAVGRSPEVPPGGSIPVDVLVPVSGPAGGSCELLGVSAA